VAAWGVQRCSSIQHTAHYYLSHLPQPQPPPTPNPPTPTSPPTPHQVGITCVKLEGSMSLDQRTKVIEAFSADPRVRVFLMSLKAGE
jgi:hypothetical protein